MQDNEFYKRQYIEALQPHIQEQILAVGMLSRANSMTRMGVSKVSPLASMVMGKKDKKKAGGLPPNVLVAITPTKVHLFDFKYRGKGVAVKQEVDSWDRSELQIGLSDKATAHRVKVSFPAEGREVELDAMKGRGFNNEMLETLTGVSFG